LLHKKRQVFKNTA